MHQPFSRPFALAFVALYSLFLALPTHATEPQERFLAFRMKDYTTVHLHDAAEADKHVKTLKSLKCEVVVSEHDGHTDVKARAERWQLMSLDSPEKVDAWKSWMTGAGFETILSQPVSQAAAKPATGTAHVEVLQYRLPKWATQHVHEPTAMAEALVIFQALGCKTDKVAHGGHTDLRIQCETWREIMLPNHNDATGWENYLKKAGFETKHEHRH